MVDWKPFWSLEQWVEKIYEGFFDPEESFS
jgi:hypothetical protein